MLIKKIFLSCKRVDLQVQLQGNVQLDRIWSLRGGSGQVELARQEWNGTTLGRSVVANFLWTTSFFPYLYLSATFLKLWPKCLENTSYKEELTLVSAISVLSPQLCWFQAQHEVEHMVLSACGGRGCPSHRKWSLSQTCPKPSQGKSIERSSELKNGKHQDKARPSETPKALTGVLSSPFFPVTSQSSYRDKRLLIQRRVCDFYLCWVINTEQWHVGC